MIHSATSIQRIVDADRIPTDEQVRVIEAPPEPLLVVAGAGSGKTETMSMRVLWLVANHEEIPPGAVLGLTFTRKAAGELGARLRERLDALAGPMGWPQDRDDPVASTYNSFAERIVAEHGLRIGVDPDFSILGQAGAVQMMTDVISSWTGDLGPDLAPATAVAAALSLASQLGEHGYDIDSARSALTEFDDQISQVGDTNEAARKLRAANRSRLALLGPIGAFHRRKRDQGLLDFSDQLVLATRIVTECPDVVDMLRREHRAVLLDEFQDTSVIQMTLLSTIFRGHPVTAVGDPNQAIYGWRGASASSLARFHERFAAPGSSAEEGRTLTLSTAWRNDELILTAANAVAAPLRDHARATTGSAPGRARGVASPVLAPRPEAGRGEVVVSYAPDQRRQAEAIVDFVCAHRAGAGRKRPTTAVLCRRKSDFPLIDRALREAGIPTQVIGVGGLLDQPIVSDVRAALQIAVDVADSPWLMRLIAGLDLGAADLVALSDWARHLAASQGRNPHLSLLLDAVDSPPPSGWPHEPGRHGITPAAVDRLALLGRRLRRVRDGAGRSLTEQVERAMRIMGVVSDSLADPLVAGGRAALDAFVDLAAGYEADAPGATLAGFLHWLAAAETEENGLSAGADQHDPDAVQILTVHAAKGLEWDSVVVAGLSDSVFPNHSARTTVTWTQDPPGVSGWINAAGDLPHPLRGDRDDLPDFALDVDGENNPSAAFNTWLKEEYKPLLGAHAEREERRLAYVALTRARSSQLLIGSWAVGGATTLKEPSRYLMEARCALNDPPGTMSDRPDPDGPKEESAPAAPQTFPPQPGPSRRRMAMAADRVRAERSQMAAGADVFDLLAQMEDEPAVRDVVALLEERRLRAERPVVELWQDSVPATSVAGLIEDPRGFALDIRRPMPTEPSPDSELGTVLHSWIERRLRIGSAEPSEDPLTDEASLDERARRRLEILKDNFEKTGFADRPALALEEPFSVRVAGASIQGRIDAVFEDGPGRCLVVDWKSGAVPTRRTDGRSLRYFITQLRLYRRAWAQRAGVDESAVSARLAFLSGPRILDLADLEEMAGGVRAGLDAQVAAALGVPAPGAG
ncbi:ATP-dependent helicase [Actinomyces sp. B33]|uniref:ATP-dependent DNA helicase n=1 Tax=Actinomyces sp. B33 TaxID=2942131 RepID=UPI002341EF1A|nr:ATP-dependent DNA helicase [Actinomyces sp. B33]MDC4233795.1 ATP-dependent helicase [Actinomyces sp. B33]